MHEILEALIDQRCPRIKETSDSVGYSELVYKTKSGIPTDFNVYKRSSGFFFSIANNSIKLSDAAEKMQYKFKKELRRVKIKRSRNCAI